MLLTKIKTLCKKNRISISRLETETGIGKNTIGKWDTVCPAINKVKAVADFFDVTIDELLTEGGEA